MRTQVPRTEKLGIVGVITPRQEEGQIQGREMMDYPEGSRMPYLGVAWGEFLRTQFTVSVHSHTQRDTDRPWMWIPGRGILRLV